MTFCSSLLKEFIRQDVRLLNIVNHDHDSRHQRVLLKSPLADVVKFLCPYTPSAFGLQPCTCRGTLNASTSPI